MVVYICLKILLQIAEWQEHRSWFSSTDLRRELGQEIQKQSGHQTWILPTHLSQAAVLRHCEPEVASEPSFPITTKSLNVSLYFWLPQHSMKSSLIIYFFEIQCLMVSLVILQDIVSDHSYFSPPHSQVYRLLMSPFPWNEEYRFILFFFWKMVHTPSHLSSPSL